MTPQNESQLPHTNARGLARNATQALGLAWRSAPGPTLGYAATTLVSACTPLALAWLTKLVIDHLATGQADPGTLTWLALAVAATGVAAALVPQVETFLQNEMDRAIGLRAQDQLFGTVERFQGLARFENPAFLDRLRLAQQAAENTSRQVIEGVFSLAQGLLTVLGFLASLFVISPLMAAAVLAAAVPALIAQLLLSRQRARMMWNVSPVERREAFYRELISTVQAAKEIRLFNLGTFLRHRMMRDRRTSNAAHRRLELRELRTQGGLSLLGAAVAGAGLLWIVTRAGQGHFAVGDIALFLAAVSGVQAGLSNMITSLANVHTGLLLFDHYRTVLNTAPELPEPDTHRPLPPLHQGIELRDVWFRYSKDHPWVLRGVDLTIPHGRTLALVGLNGAGKSSLVKLLCRFYDPEHGSIHWDGTDLRDIDPKELRNRVGAVFQDYMSYDMTAHDNIALGDLAHVDDGPQITRAARSAGIHDTLTELPRGYRTLLSRIFTSELDRDDPTTGVVPSGGQWQRLALARGFLRGDRDLMILDEPSSGLDAEAEHEIHTRLTRHRRGRTSLLISHRLGVMREADTIVVLDQGRITETGTHAELLALEGTYAHLFTLQADGYRGTDTITDTATTDGDATSDSDLKSTSDTADLTPGPGHP